jgi:hypothetical protein
MDRERVNAITSIFGLDNPSAWINNQRKDGKRYVAYDINKATAFLQTVGSERVGGSESNRLADESLTQTDGENNSENAQEEKFSLSDEADSEGRQLTQAQAVFSRTAKSGTRMGG